MRAAWNTYTPYLHLHRALKVSHDTTAHTDVLTRLIHTSGMDREEATKTAILAALTTDLGATCTAIDQHRTGTPLGKLPDTAMTRTGPLRAERTSEALTHYAALAKHAGSFTTLIAEQLTGDVEDDQRTITRLFAHVPGASERTARRITRTLGLCAGWDLAHNGHPRAFPLSSHAHAGLALLAPTHPQRDAADLFAVLVADTADSLGHPDGEGLDPHGVADTLACLHRLNCGTYYVGLHIDQMQADLIRAPRTELTTHAWQARSRCLPHRYLGERSGWYGPVPDRKQAYRATGRILVRRAPA